MPRPFDPPLIGILRGLTPPEAPAIGAALLEAGFAAFEVPLNSPDAPVSIARLAQAFGDRVAIGAGTVLRPAEVDAAAAAGARFIVSPNTEAAVIARALALGLEPLPGVLTPSEAFAAIAAGARRLKLFPAASCGPLHLRALRSVLPAEVEVFAVGGVGAADFPAWRQAGAAGFGLGGELYRPGDAAATVAARARALIAAWRAL